jgi:integrase/recombinase XerD
MKCQVKFRLREKNEREGYVQPYITINGKKIRFSIPNAIIDKSNWSDGYPKRNKATSRVRADMDEFKMLLDDFIKDVWKKKDRLPTKTELDVFISKEVFQYKFKKESIQSVFTEFIEFKRNLLQSNGRIGISQGGIYQNLNAFDFLKEFKNNLEFDDINEKFGNDFIVWLLREKKLQTSYINGMVKKIKGFLKWAHEKEFTSFDHSKYFKRQKERNKPIIALTKEELNKLEIAELDSKKLRGCLDLYLIACYTGMAYADVCALTSSHIIEIEGVNHISKNREKTSVPFLVPLLPKAMEILEKYSYVLPIISDQKCNSYLKEIFKKLEFNRPIKIEEHRGAQIETLQKPLCEVINFHSGRKTFITNCLRNGIKSYFVKKMSGHNDEREFQKYISVVDQELAREMQKWDENILQQMTS